MQSDSNMKSEEHITDLNQQEYQDPDPTRIIWKPLQDLRLGADRDPWSVGEDVQKKFEKDHRLCLVAKGLHPLHQNSPGLKVSLPRTWQLVRKVEGQVNDDGTVNFYFEKKHQMLKVLENQPYTYRGWLVVLDKWSNQSSPTFLRQIPFKIKISNLPNIYRRHDIIEDIGSKLGQVEEVIIREPTPNRKAAVWVKVSFDVDDEITLTRRVEIMKNKEPVQLKFRYMGLEKFCTFCGSLKHEFEVCEKYADMKQRQYELMDIGTNPYMSVQQRLEAIGEYNQISEVGESSGTAENMQVETTIPGAPGAQEEQQPQQETAPTLMDQQTLSVDPPLEQGTKRKIPETTDDEATTSSKRLETERTENGLVVLLKPLDRP